MPTEPAECGCLDDALGEWSLLWQVQPLPMPTLVANNFAELGASSARRPLFVFAQSQRMPSLGPSRHQGQAFKCPPGAGARPRMRHSAGTAALENDSIARRRQHPSLV